MTILKLRNCRPCHFNVSRFITPLRVTIRVFSTLKDIGTLARVIGCSGLYLLKESFRLGSGNALFLFRLLSGAVAGRRNTGILKYDDTKLLIWELWD